MFHHRIFMTVALLVVSVGSTRSAPCPSDCTCPNDIQARCNNRGLTRPPPGYFPNIEQLELTYNKIENIGAYDLSGFPNLEWLDIQHNPSLTEIDMNAFVHAQSLRNFKLRNNNIQKVIPLDADKKLPKVLTLYLEGNNITSLPENFLDGFPVISYLDLGGNHLVLPGDRPLFRSATLEYLTLTDADATAVTSETFKALPNLGSLFLHSAIIQDINDSLASLTKLRSLSMARSTIKEIKRGSFSKEQNFAWADLDDTQLEVLQPSALDGIVQHWVTIKNTPMACNCDYEALYWWGIARGISIQAECKNGPTCQFTRRSLISRIKNLL